MSLCSYFEQLLYFQFYLYFYIALINFIVVLFNFNISAVATFLILIFLSCKVIIQQPTAKSQFFESHQL